MTSPPDPLIGQTIDRKYRVLALLGRGGMGVVYRAEHVHTGRVLALKLMRPELASDPAFQRRFEAEARAIGSLRHPNVVDIVDFGYAGIGDGRAPYLVMELLEGHPLSRPLEQPGDLPWSWVRPILEDVCRAVDAAHAAGVVHGDLKPENIWLRPRRSTGYDVTVVDFGLGRVTRDAQPDESSPAVGDAAWTLSSARTTIVSPAPGASTPLSGRAGTPAYMAPERLQGAPPSESSDVYALGVLAHYVLTGSLPQATHPAQGPGADLATRRPDVPAQAVEAIRAALEPDPRRRLRTAMSLADALRGHDALGAPSAHESRRRPVVGGLVAAAKACFGGLRWLRREPALALTATATFAIGIGAAVALFAVVKAVLLDPLPFPDSGRIVQVWRSELPALTYGSASYARYLDWRAAQEPFSEFGAWTPRDLTITGDDTPERVSAGLASSAFFRVLGVEPVLGRWVTDADDRPESPPVAVISEGLWARRFQRAPSAVGATVTLDGVVHTIVGVAPASVSEVWRPQVWVALSHHTDRTNRGNNFLLTFGRLRAGTTLDGARASLARLAAQMTREHPEDEYTFTARRLHDVITETVAARLWLVLAAALLLLAIACANVTGLLLVRAATRERDLAVRAALGARRSELFGHILGEAIALALVGGVAGAAMAWTLLRVFVASAPAGFPRLASISPDAGLLMVATIVAFLVALLCSVVPAAHVFGADLNAVVRGAGDRGATAGRVRATGRLLVVTEVALACALVVAAGLLARSLDRLQQQDLGFTSSPMLTFAVALPGSPRPDNRATVRFHSDLLAGLRAQPGVRLASAINMLPIAATGNNGTVQRADQLGEHEGVPVTEFRVVMDDYLSAMGVRLVAGRAISERDDVDSPPVAVVNEALARRLWPGRAVSTVVGERVKAPWDAGGVFREVIGVMADVRSRRPDAPPEPEIHAPFRQVPLQGLSYVVQADGDPAQLTGPIREVVGRLAPGVAMASVRTFGDVVAASTRTPALLSRLSSVFAGLAAALAVVGVYSVLSYGVAQRRREFAIRASIGAAPAALVADVVREGLWMTGLGITVGLVLSWLTTGLIQRLLYDVSATDPLVWLAAVVSLAIAAACGYLVPAIRASRVDPAIALRTE